MKIKVVCISDTHGMEDRITLPPGDLLLHAGDISNVGEIDQLEKFNTWIGEQSFEKKVCIPGNHDRTLASNPEYKDVFTNCDLLIDSFTTFRGLKIYGSPWTPWFGGHYWAFNRKRGLSIADAWNKIPLNTDILITHGPPFGILDFVPHAGPQGCEELLKTVRKIKPRIHVFGHLHDSGGQKKYLFGSDIMFVNASVCTEGYKPTNDAVVVEIESQ